MAQTEPTKPTGQKKRRNSGTLWKSPSDRGGGDEWATFDSSFNGGESRPAQMERAPSPSPTPSGLSSPPPDLKPLPQSMVKKRQQKVAAQAPSSSVSSGIEADFLGSFSNSTSPPAKSAGGKSGGIDSFMDGLFGDPSPAPAANAKPSPIRSQANGRPPAARAAAGGGSVSSQDWVSFGDSGDLGTPKKADPRDLLKFAYSNARPATADDPFAGL